MPQECGSGYLTDGIVIYVWTRRDVKGRSHAARIGTDAVPHVATALQTLVSYRAGVPWASCEMGTPFHGISVEGTPTMRLHRPGEPSWHCGPP